MNYLVLACIVVLAAICTSEAATKRCKNANDCEEDECCVNYAVVTLFGGYCQKLRKEGQSCSLIVSQKEENPDMHHFQCPCKEGLKCAAKHEIKVGDFVIRNQPECVVPEGDTVAPEPETTVLPIELSTA